MIKHKVLQCVVAMLLLASVVSAQESGRGEFYIQYMPLLTTAKVSTNQQADESNQVRELRESVLEEWLLREPDWHSLYKRLGGVGEPEIVYHSHKKYDRVEGVTYSGWAGNMDRGEEPGTYCTLYCRDEDGIVSICSATDNSGTVIDFGTDRSILVSTADGSEFSEGEIEVMEGDTVISSERIEIALYAGVTYTGIKPVSRFVVLSNQQLLLQYAQGVINKENTEHCTIVIDSFIYAIESDEFVRISHTRDLE